jgi:hypothetical protein
VVAECTLEPITTIPLICTLQDAAFDKVGNGRPDAHLFLGAGSLNY